MRNSKWWVPRIVSSAADSKRFYQREGTKAFVLGKNQLRHMCNYDRKLALMEIAQNADFFIKSVSLRNLRIRKKLESRGVIVEHLMQDLGNGKYLIQKTGSSLSSSQGLKKLSTNSNSYVSKLTHAISQMHSSGIIHGHLHGGNIVVVGEKVGIIDLGKAREFSPTTKSSKIFLGLANDLVRGSTAIATALLNAKKINKANFSEVQFSIQEQIVNGYSLELKKRLGKQMIEDLICFVENDFGC